MGLSSSGDRPAPVLTRSTNGDGPDRQHRSRSFLACEGGDITERLGCGSTSGDLPNQSLTPHLAPLLTMVLLLARRLDLPFGWALCMARPTFVGTAATAVLRSHASVSAAPDARAGRLDGGGG